MWPRQKGFSSCQWQWQPAAVPSSWPLSEGACDVFRHQGNTLLNWKVHVRGLPHPSMITCFIPAFVHYVPPAKDVFSSIYKYLYPAHCSKPPVDISSFLKHPRSLWIGTHLPHPSQSPGCKHHLRLHDYFHIVVAFLEEHLLCPPGPWGHHNLVPTVKTHEAPCHGLVGSGIDRAVHTYRAGTLDRGDRSPLGHSQGRDPWSGIMVGSVPDS